VLLPIAADRFAKLLGNFTSGKDSDGNMSFSMSNSIPDDSGCKSMIFASASNGIIEQNPKVKAAKKMINSNFVDIL
jgi:hypothetical protein